MFQNISQGQHTTSTTMMPGIQESVRNVSSRAFNLVGLGQPVEVTDLRPAWDALLTDRDNLYLQYQSPQWWDHLNASGQGGSTKLLALQTATGVAGIVPLQTVVGSINLVPVRSLHFNVSIACADVLGGQPLLPVDSDVAQGMFKSIFASLPGIQAVYFKSVPDTSAWYDTLIDAANKSKGCFPHITREEMFHSLTIPETFDGFLQRFPAKKRYNLKRQVRLMEEASNGQLRLATITRADQVDDFLAAATDIAAGSWKNHSVTLPLARTADNRALYADLARRGLLRAYVLRSGETAVACALGYQFETVYHYADTAHLDREMRLSPGMVLLLLIVRDLIENTRIRRLNFGIGDDDYKRQFADRHTRDRTIWVMRSSLRNRLICAVHSAIATALRGAKKMHGVQWLRNARLIKHLGRCGSPHNAIGTGLNRGERP